MTANTLLTKSLPDDPDYNASRDPSRGTIIPSPLMSHTHAIIPFPFDPNNMFGKPLFFMPEHLVGGRPALIYSQRFIVGEMQKLIREESRVQHLRSLPECEVKVGGKEELKQPDAWRLKLGWAGAERTELRSKRHHFYAHIRSCGHLLADYKDKYVWDHASGKWKAATGSGVETDRRESVCNELERIDELRYWIEDQWHTKREIDEQAAKKNARKRKRTPENINDVFGLSKRLLVVDEAPAKDKENDNEPLQNHFEASPVGPFPTGEPLQPDNDLLFKATNTTGELVHLGVVDQVKPSIIAALPEEPEETDDITLERKQRSESPEIANSVESAEDIDLQARDPAQLLSEPAIISLPTSFDDKSSNDPAKDNGPEVAKIDTSLGDSDRIYYPQAILEDRLSFEFAKTKPSVSALEKEQSTRPVKSYLSTLAPESRKFELTEAALGYKEPMAMLNDDHPVEPKPRKFRGNQWKNIDGTPKLSQDSTHFIPTYRGKYVISESYKLNTISRFASPTEANEEHEIPRVSAAGPSTKAASASNQDYGVHSDPISISSDEQARETMTALGPSSQLMANRGPAQGALRRRSAHSTATEPPQSKEVIEISDDSEGDSTMTTARNAHVRIKVVDSTFDAVLGVFKVKRTAQFIILKSVVCKREHIKLSHLTTFWKDHRGMKHTIRSSDTPVNLDMTDAATLWIELPRISPVDTGSLRYPWWNSEIKEYERVEIMNDTERYLWWKQHAKEEKEREARTGKHVKTQEDQYSDTDKLDKARLRKSQDPKSPDSAQTRKLSLSASVRLTPSKSARTIEPSPRTTKNLAIDAGFRSYVFLNRLALEDRQAWSNFLSERQLRDEHIRNIAEFYDHPRSAEETRTLLQNIAERYPISLGEVSPRKDA